MKKYKFVILVLFLASITTILVLCLRDKTFLQVKRDQLIIEKKETKPFPITNEVWPQDLNWHNGMEQKTFSSPKATKGGTWNTSMLSFPPNFRQVGPDSNSGFRGYLDINDLSLTSIHPETRELYPQLAKSWAIHPDKKTVYFQLDPDARWDDGQAVTADDYIFRLKAMRSPSIIAPWYNQYYSTMLDEILKFDDHRIAVRLPKPIADLVLRVLLENLACPVRRTG